MLVSGVKRSGAMESASRPINTRGLVSASSAIMRRCSMSDLAIGLKKGRSGSFISNGSLRPSLPA
jgi:hypothetical protein